MLGRIGDLLGGRKVAFERSKRTGIYLDNKVIEVGHHVVNRTKRATDLIGERSCFQAAQAIGLDRPLSGGNQCISKALPAFCSLAHGPLTKLCERRSNLS